MSTWKSTPGHHAHRRGQRTRGSPGIAGNARRHAAFFGHMDGWWAVQLYLSWKLLEELTGAPHEAEMRGNFYTCDESIHPRSGCWSPVLAPAPDRNFGNHLKAKEETT